MILDLIIFQVGEGKFAISLDIISRIISVPKITPHAVKNDYIEGMISYEKEILQVLSMRKLLNQTVFEEELHALFLDLKAQHYSWFDALKESIEKGVEFHGALDAHLCNLGKWLDNFTSYDDKVSDILRNLKVNHAHLHALGAEVITLYKEGESEKAKELYYGDVASVFHQTMGASEQFIAEYKVIADSLQKLLLYKEEDNYFSIKVDKIIDIIHIEEEKIVHSKSVDSVNESEFVEYIGVLELESDLINVIKTIKLPTK